VLSLIITSFARQFCTIYSGACVRLAEEQEIPLDQLTFEQLQKIDSRFTEDVMKVWDYEMSVERKCSVGGTSKARVLEQIEKCLAFSKTL
jgi:argininosuccinate lyase